MSRLRTVDGNPESDLDREVDRRYPLKAGPTMASIPLDELKALEEKAAALDLLEAWLDVHYDRAVSYLGRTGGKVNIVLTVSGRGGDEYQSFTQETLASAIRTCLGIAYANGDR